MLLTRFHPLRPSECVSALSGPATSANNERLADCQSHCAAIHGPSTQVLGTHGDLTAAGERSPTSTARAEGLRVRGRCCHLDVCAFGHAGGADLTVAVPHAQTGDARLRSSSGLGSCLCGRKPCRMGSPHSADSRGSRNRAPTGSPPAVRVGTPMPRARAGLSGACCQTRAEIPVILVGGARLTRQRPHKPNRAEITPPTLAGIRQPGPKPASGLIHAAPSCSSRMRRAISK